MQIARRSRGHASAREQRNSPAEAKPSRMRPTGAAGAVRARASSQAPEHKRGLHTCSQTDAAEAMRARASSQTAELERGLHTCSQTGAAGGHASARERRNSQAQARPSRARPTDAAEATRARARNQTAELKRSRHVCGPLAQRRLCERKRAAKQPSSSKAFTHAAIQVQRRPCKRKRQTAELKRGLHTCGQTGAAEAV